MYPTRPSRRRGTIGFWDFMAQCAPPLLSWVVRRRRASSVSWYLTITPAAGQPLVAEARPLVEFLAALPELRQTGPVAFEAAPGKPWV